MVTKFRQEYDFLSNFYPCQIIYDSMLFNSTEAAYMSAKSHDPLWKAFCQDPFNSASLIKKHSKLKYIPAHKSVHVFELREDWDDVKLKVMEDVLRLKFKHAALAKKLLDTGSQNIQEGNEWHDTFWGIDITVTPNFGENHLGRLLMKIRDELRAISIPVASAQQETHSAQG